MRLRSQRPPTWLIVVLAAILLAMILAIGVFVIGGLLVVMGYNMNESLKHGGL